ncbi:segmentation protein cap'n'collar-like isoform X2 [Daphnia carinata]|uniref:segmentation protein cap'n'collar-like isoform X2 n=1 Tax=Daphnia carinata TaxID=120202 RepID=UPI00257E2B4F|nr:segmentation protein cap'n'collar-like isoform X2 [Daphnia carinata]
MVDIDLPVMTSFSPEPDSPVPSTSRAKTPTKCSIFEEDADLIEILWKQDIDIGAPRDHFLFPGEESSDIEDVEITTSKDKLYLKGEHKDKTKHGEKKKLDEDPPDKSPSDDDPWAGLSYRIDDETGEYILLEDIDHPQPSTSTSGEESKSSEAEEKPSEEPSLPSEDSDSFSLDKAFGFVDYDEEKLTESNFTLGALSPESAEFIGELDPVLGSIVASRSSAQVPVPNFGSLLSDGGSSGSPRDDSLSDLDLGFYFGTDDDRAQTETVEDGDDEEEELLKLFRPESSSSNSIDVLSEQLEASLEDMIQTAQMHPRSLQVRMPLMRTMSMEHRWQDLANFLSLPDGAAAAAAAANLSSHPGHHHHHHHHGGHHPHPVHHTHHHPGHPHHAMHTLGHHPHSPHPAFAHPGYPHPHSPHGSIHPHHHHNGSSVHTHHGYGVHPASPATTTAVHHHHGYSGLTSAAAPVSAYTNSAVDVGGRASLLQNVAIGSPLTELGGNGSYPSPGLGVGVTLGSAVTASMNLTNSTDTLEPTGQVPYKTETTADMHLYYQNNAGEVNQTGDGFFPSIFNEDDLQLMDMAITDTMYPPRLLDNQPVNHSLGLAPTNSGGNPVASIIPSTVIDTTSDSAVSSMGSERGPSISDGDWIDTSNATDSNTTSVTGATAVMPSGSAYGMEYSSGAKYRNYDYGYGGRSSGLEGASTSGRGSAAGTPVAQKKHQMFGKRVFHDQSDLPGSPATVTAIGSPAKFDYGSSASANSGSLYSHPSTPLDTASGMNSMDLKYACGIEYNPHSHDVRGMDHVHHNHTYALGSEASGTSQRPVSRDKHRASGSSLRGSVSDSASTPGAGTSGSLSESEAYSRDEKRARSMNIPMTVDDIINLPMDEFNERLSKYDLTEPQLSLIRDIRRRGKNKVAAQNCRKRKLDQILTLADEVKRARERKIRLNKEREFLAAEKTRIKDRFAQLYRHVFQSLRDADGQPYSPYEYSLQQSADGNILLVPRATAVANGGATIDPQPPMQQQLNHHQHHHQQQHVHNHHNSNNGQHRPVMIDPSSLAGQMVGNVNGGTVGSSSSAVLHGARRKTPDQKNEP